jgi:hypothetical protein
VHALVVAPDFGEVGVLCLTARLGQAAPVTGELLPPSLSLSLSLVVAPDFGEVGVLCLTARLGQAAPVTGEAFAATLYWFSLR